MKNFLEAIKSELKTAKAQRPKILYAIHRGKIDDRILSEHEINEFSRDLAFLDGKIDVCSNLLSDD